MNVERTTDPQGGVIYNFGPNNIIQRPAWPTAMDASEPANFTEYAVEAYGSYLDFIKKIAADESLSAKGKADRLDPKSAEALEVMARTSAALDKFDHDTDMKEAVLVNVPAMDATATAEAAIDVEVRQWWRGLTESERARQLGRMLAHPILHQRATLALLRSPVAAWDRNMRELRASWDDARRAADPATTEAITAAREVSDVARRTLAHVAGKTAITVRWERGRMLEAILGAKNEFTQRGYGVFGFPEQEVQRTKLLMEAKQRKAS